VDHVNVVASSSSSCHASVCKIACLKLKQKIAPKKLYTKKVRRQTIKEFNEAKKKIENLS